MGNRQKRKKKKNKAMQNQGLPGQPNPAPEEQEFVDPETGEQVEPVRLPPRKAEEVLVVNRGNLFGAQNDHYFQGFLSVQEAGDRFLRILQDPAKAYFAVRDIVEKDPNKKQIIPYCVFTYSHFGQPHIYVMRRLQGATEERLHDLYSIGIGGHINPEDDRDEETRKLLEANAHFWRLPRDAGITPEQFASPLWSGMKREFDEEVSYPSNRLPRIIGYINDDSNSVGKVHFGVVFLIKGGRPDIETNEPDQLEGKLLSVEALGEDAEAEAKNRKGYIENFENWSKIVYPHVKNILSSKQ
ncbi:hypothetical protein GF371_02655 [Candidatus Woesearchaeota archaeon]|nr:hypothetical protein [Candidatus Woesearchaeota archaeon]